ncbi:unnamed protein product, partial [marine sediment metagenome]
MVRIKLKMHGIKSPKMKNEEGTILQETVSVRPDSEESNEISIYSLPSSVFFTDAMFRESLINTVIS